MKPYVVKQGDYLEKIAHQMGFDPDKVWNDAKNADAQAEARSEPVCTLPGDILYVPEPEKKWLPLQENWHGTTSMSPRSPGPRCTSRSRRGDQARAGEAYVIHGMGEDEEGTTDGDGALDVKVPVHVREIHIFFPNDGATYAARIGDMDPVDEPTGVRKRLQHLGFYDARPGEDVAAADARALGAYQAARGLSPSGTPDDATRSRRSCRTTVDREGHYGLASTVAMRVMSSCQSSFACTGRGLNTPRCRSPL